MKRFADSPYFLLKDFMLSLVSPVRPEYVNPDLVNLYKRVVFTDVIWVGGNPSMETSTDQLDTLDRYPSFDPVTDQSVQFTSNDIAWNFWIDRSPMANYHIDDSEPYAGMLRMGDNYGTIIVEGGSYVDMYAKIDEFGFVPVRMRPLYEEPREKKYFRFNNVEVSTIKTNDIENILLDSNGHPILDSNGEYIITVSGTPSDSPVVRYDSDNPVDEPFYDSDFVTILTYDYEYDTSPLKWGDLTIDDILKNSVEIYFRKDSAFQDWLKTFAHNYYKDMFDIDYVIRNYVNTDKRFIYFGEIYHTIKENVSDPELYHIVFNGMKDWVRSALPAPNRTEKATEFFDTYFDQLYSEGYQLLKDVWTLRDARETDRKYLGYIPTFYDMPNEGVIDDWFLEQYREYAAELIWLMKRKGTYSSMYIIYDILCRNSSNIFNVMERWHDNVSGIITDYEDHIYTELYGKDTPDGMYGAGPFWYSKFDKTTYPDGYVSSDNRMLSPFYRVDLDLSVQPMNMEYIMPEQLAKALHNNWELQRPVNRQTEYNFIYAPYTDLTGQSFSLYDSPYTGQSITRSVEIVSFDDNNSIYIQRKEKDVWVATHELYTEDLYVNVFNENFERIVPDVIKVMSDDTIRIEFPVEVRGFAVISTAGGVDENYNPITWTILHGQNRKEILYQLRDGGNTVVNEDNGYIVNNNVIAIDNVEAGSKVFVGTGLSIGDPVDYDGDGVDDGVITQDVWVFDNTTKVTPNYNYNGTDWIAWEINHEYPMNVFQTQCYNENNERVEPAQILLNELNSSYEPILVVLWELSSRGDVDDYLGFAAIHPVGDLISFSGIVPIDPNGNMLGVKYRLTIETDDEIFTFLTEGDRDATLIESIQDKKIHYYNYSTPEEKTFVWGDVQFLEEDDNWYYYTFVVKNEGLEQLEEREYMIKSIEIYNDRIHRLSKQRIVYSSLSGIYKPFGVNFVGHFRIFKDPLGFGSVLLDHINDPLLDEDIEYLYG
jgi:hypothetical protein